MTNYRDFKQEQLKDPEVRKEYDLIQKRIEIREGIRGFIDKAQGYIEDCCPIDDITNSLITYLHSQGVVILKDMGTDMAIKNDYVAVDKLIEVEK